MLDTINEEQFLVALRDHLPAPSKALLRFIYKDVASQGRVCCDTVPPPPQSGMKSCHGYFSRAYREVLHESFRLNGWAENPANLAYFMWLYLKSEGLQCPMSAQQFYFYYFGPELHYEGLQCPWHAAPLTL